MKHLTLCLFFTLSSGVAFAQEQECKGDIKKFCKNATGKDILDCIEQHQADYSVACKKKIADVKAKWTDMVKSCRPDLEKTCGADKVADGTLGKCVKANENKVSGDCKSAYAAMKAAGSLPSGLKAPKGFSKH